MSADPALPLVVDLDGTLTPTDTLVESVLRVLRQSPLNVIRMPFWLGGGRRAFKQAIAERTELPAHSLPYREDLLDYLREQKARGRRIVLATAAHKSIANAVAEHLGLFDQVLATGTGANLKGEAKLAAIRAQVGEDFVYAGDSAADLPVWRGARGAILVDVSAANAEAARAHTPVEREFHAEPRGIGLWLKALRLHQWIKNLLLFVPMLTALGYMDPGLWATAIQAFLAFSLTASATYVVNDLWDLDNDRAHPRKCRRPFASARLPIGHGLAAAAGVLGLGLVLALLVSPAFLFTVLLYLVLTSAYSWLLKHYVLIDVMMLSLLFTLRIVAGAVALGTGLSSWLLAFSVFIFISLALVKRCAELVSLDKSGVSAASGRDYRVSDLVVLWPLGVGTAIASVIVLGFFIGAPETQLRYGTPMLLWLLAFILIYWLARLWVKTSRGEMHDDPLVFALKDAASRIAVLAMVAVVLAAHLLHLGSVF
ncbi:MAG: UbiA family prenyltransferase [Gammaproteobacteria bacterium]